MTEYRFAFANFFYFAGLETVPLSQNANIGNMLLHFAKAINDFHQGKVPDVSLVGAAEYGFLSRKYLSLEPCSARYAVCHVFSGMALTEIAVLYLACGAPIAVFQFLQFRREGFKRKWLVPVGVLLLWPFAGFILLTRNLCKKRFNKQLEKPAELGWTTRLIIADLIGEVSHATALPVFRVRELVGRYASLAQEGAVNTRQRSAENLLRAAGRKGIGTSLRCMERRNAARIERHQTHTRISFLALIQQAASGEIRNKALGLAELLGDTAAVRELSCVELADTVGYDLWNPGQRSTTADQQPLRFQTLATATGSSKND